MFAVFVACPYETLDIVGLYRTLCEAEAHIDEISPMTQDDVFVRELQFGTNPVV